MATAKSIEISADSANGFDEALKNGVKAASEKLDNVETVWVKNQEASVENGKIANYRVWLKVTFRLN